MIYRASPHFLLLANVAWCITSLVSGLARTQTITTNLASKRFKDTHKMAYFT